jgi:peptidoglycan hydrolase CwlO-like protein
MREAHRVATLGLAMLILCMIVIMYEMKRDSQSRFRVILDRHVAPLNSQTEGAKEDLTRHEEAIQQLQGEILELQNRVNELEEKK